MRGKLVASVCVTVLLCVSTLAESHPEELIFTNVNVVDTRSGEILPNMTVVVREGRILAVAKLGLIGTGRDYHVVNAGGKYLIPGLWDMDVRAATSGWDERILYPLFVVNGVTGVREMSGLQEAEGGRGLPPHTGIDLSGVLAPHVMDAADFVRVRTSQLVASPAQASPPSEHNPRTLERMQGFALACSSREEQLQREEQEAIARQDTAAYAALAAQAAASYDPAKARQFFIELANHGTWQVPELVWGQNERPVSADPRMKYVPENAWAPFHDSGATSIDHKFQIIADMRRAGLQFLSGTGAPGGYAFPGFALHDELELLVKSGLTTLQALQSATLNPAIFMAKLDQFGVVEKGRVADLVLLDDNPLQDIRNTRKIAAVVLAGKYYSRDNLNTLLPEVAALAKDSRQYRVSNSQTPPLK